MLSTVERRNRVVFPEFTGERIYMREFRQIDGLPRGLERWQETVDQMLQGLRTEKSIFIMVDQSKVIEGQPQRRPGVHIDGVWVAGHWDNGGWKTGQHDTGGHRFIPEDNQLILLASDVQGCAAYVGEYDGTPGEGGDFQHLDLSQLQKTELEPMYCYGGNAMTMLHESLPMRKTVDRTLVRLNVSV
jgi:hypothetical protein